MRLRPETDSWQVINWIIAFTTPLFLAKSSSGPYFLFGACSLVTTLVCVAYQPETRGASLEDVDETFVQSPWKSLVQSSVFSRFGRMTEVHRRATSNAAPSDPQDDEFELDVIHLPEVGFATPRRYAHQLIHSRLARFLQALSPPD